MVEGKKVLAVITARGGSKAIPRKNICLAGGKPLIAWTIDEAKKSKYIDRLILSSDDPEIISVAESLGCEVPFVRPAEYAFDDVSAIAPVIHALQELPGYDLVVLLQPTSPLRTAGDIDGALEHLLRQGAKSCVSVTLSGKSPYWMFNIDQRGYLSPVMESPLTSKQRQELPEVFVVNGAVYVAESDWLIQHKTFYTDQTLAYRMPAERSLDVDTPMDLEYLEFVLDRRENRN